MLPAPPPLVSSGFQRPGTENLDADVLPDYFDDKRPIDPIREADGPHLSYVAACECGAWQLWFWPKKDPAQIKSMAFRCQSWRHAGECRLWKGAQDFVRVKEAIEKHKHWCHITLTFLQPEGADKENMYREGVVKWAKLRKRMVREFGAIQYVQTWERHRSGYPHVHLAVTNKELYARSSDTPRKNWNNHLRDAAVECGFGQIGWIEQLRNKAAMAGYLTKLARELTGRGKDYQTPINAPRHFRRLRASVRLLPPIHHNPDISGVLKFFPKNS